MGNCTFHSVKAKASRACPEPRRALGAGGRAARPPRSGHGARRAARAQRPRPPGMPAHPHRCYWREGHLALVFWTGTLAGAVRSAAFTRSCASLHLARAARTFHLVQRTRERGTQAAAVALRKGHGIVEALLPPTFPRRCLHAPSPLLSAHLKRICLVTGRAIHRHAVAIVSECCRKGAPKSAQNIMYIRCLRASAVLLCKCE